MLLIMYQHYTLMFIKITIQGFFGSNHVVWRKDTRSLLIQVYMCMCEYTRRGIYKHSIVYSGFNLLFA